MAKERWEETKFLFLLIVSLFSDSQCSLKHFLLCFAAGAVNVLMVPQVGGNGVGKVAGTLIQANCSFVSREKC